MLLRCGTLRLMTRRCGSSVAPNLTDRIGNREVVGFGFNGLPSYVDRPDFPFPAIRFKAPTSDVQALREKEKGDWKKLSIEEKKALYRASFRQTFAEIEAPTGEWKSVVGWGLIFVSIGIWLHMFVRAICYDGTLPDSFKEEHRVAQLKRMLAFKMNPVYGISSKYDYENNTWKK